MLICPEQRLVESTHLKTILIVSKPESKKQNRKKKDMPEFKAKL